MNTNFRDGFEKIAYRVTGGTLARKQFKEALKRAKKSPDQVFNNRHVSAWKLHQNVKGKEMAKRIGDDAYRKMSKKDVNQTMKYFKKRNG